jgi:hypothetical protein
LPHYRLKAAVPLGKRRRFNKDFAVHDAVPADLIHCMASGRLSKGKKKRTRVTLRLEDDLAKGIKRAASKKDLSQADYIDLVVRPQLIADGIVIVL